MSFTLANLMVLEVIIFEIWFKNECLKKHICTMRKIVLAPTLLFLACFVSAQEYKAHYSVGYKRTFGTLTNPYANMALTEIKEKTAYGQLTFGAEGMDERFFISFRTDFLGLLPDYLFKALNKNNTALPLGDAMKEFDTRYNTIPRQYPYAATFSDWDVLGGTLAYGYKYAFLGANFFWSNTSLNAYEVVSNTKVRELKPADFRSFNSKATFTYGVNLVVGNNIPENPLRLIVGYNWMIIRDYNDAWTFNNGNRFELDLKWTLPFRFKKEGRSGVYVGSNYRRYTIRYAVPSVLPNNENTQTFKAGLFSLEAGVFF